MFCFAVYSIVNGNKLSRLFYDFNYSLLMLDFFFLNISLGGSGIDVAFSVEDLCI